MTVIQHYPIAIWKGREERERGRKERERRGRDRREGVREDSVCKALPVQLSCK